LIQIRYSSDFYHNLSFITQLLRISFVVTHSELGNPSINIFEDNIFHGLLHLSEFLSVFVGLFIFIIGDPVRELRPS